MQRWYCGSTSGGNDRTISNKRSPFTASAIRVSCAHITGTPHQRTREAEEAGGGGQPAQAGGRGLKSVAQHAPKHLTAGQQLRIEARQRCAIDARVALAGLCIDAVLQEE